MIGVSEPNRIPAEPIVALVSNYLGEVGERNGDGSFSKASVYTFADRVDIKGDTLDHILRGRNQTMDFDLADRMLCAMNLNDLWQTDLAEIYEGATLYEGDKQFVVRRASGAKVCARRGCSDLFVPSLRCPSQKYCSTTCGGAAWQHEHRGVKTRIRGKGNAIQKLICVNGHERTAENTKIDKRGRRICLICKRSTDRASAKRRYDARLGLA